MEKNNGMKKSEIAYVMAHLAQDLASECASNEELTALYKEQRATLARYKDGIKKLEDESATWQKRYYARVEEYDKLVIKIKVKCEEAGVDYADLFPEDETDNYDEDTFGFN